MWATLALLSGCSTTSHLPEGETLYVGIDKIDYSQVPQHSRKIRRDSVGVITTIGDVVNTVSDVLSGTSSLSDLANVRRDDGDVVVDNSSTADAEGQAVLREALKTAKSEVGAVLAYAPNNALFGSSSLRSPLQFELWFYNMFVNSKGKFGKWMFKNFAGAPVLISTVSPATRAKVAQNTLENYGFFRGKVDYEILPQKNPKKAKIKYNVQVGPLSRLDSIAYLRFTPAQQQLVSSSMDDRLLRSGDAFSVVNLANERTRLGNLFRENGYYYWEDNFTAYKADTLMRRGYVQLQVQPSPMVSERANHPWYMGNVIVAMRRNERDRLDKTRTRRNYTYQYGGNKMPLRANMWRHAITHRHGEPYSKTDQRATLEKLNRIGVFSQLDVNYVPRDTAASCDTLDLYVTALLDKPFNSNLEMNATLKSNDQLGPGLSYTINKINAFRGGEKLSFKIFGSYEWQLHAAKGVKRSQLNSYELGAQLSLHFPRFYAPFISRRRLRFPAETTVAVDVDWRRRSSFFTLVSAGLGLTYNWHKKATVLHELTPLNIDFDNIIHTSDEFKEIMDANPALYTSMRDQYIPSMSYLFTYTSSESHRNSLMIQLFAKEAGNVTSGIFAIAGKKFSQQGKKILGSPFAQFLKTTFEARYSVPFGERFRIATRFFAGAIWSYGNQLVAPYAEQFYVGGANSVRGFAVRSIGPGPYRSDNRKYAYIDQTGDFKLEANAELRMRLFGSLHGAIFADAGNVWLMRDDPMRPNAQISGKNLKYIAVGTGAGLRYDLSFLVLRFDVGIGLHAPYDTGKRGFYNLEKFRDGLNFHFAIGYPF